MTYTPTDHDNDGILSIFEDVDGDGKPLGMILMVITYGICMMLMMMVMVF